MATKAYVKHMKYTDQIDRWKIVRSNINLRHTFRTVRKFIIGSESIRSVNFASALIIIIIDFHKNKRYCNLTYCIIIIIITNMS